MAVVIGRIAALGPIALILLGLSRLIRPLFPRHRDMPKPRPVAGPRSHGDGAGDRSPRHPIVPVLNGGAALAIPVEEAAADDPEPRRVVRHGQSSDRLAG